VRIWVDCTAAPHPLVLRPIIDGLTERGHEVEVTAREYGQTLGVLDRLGIAHQAIGRHAGAGSAAKATALARRSTALGRWARGRGFALALAHGSVDLAVVASVLRIPSVQMQDYEFAGLQRRISWRAARRVIVPEAIPLERLERAGANARKLFRYPGLKEDYYLADFVPDPGVVEAAGLDAVGIRADRGDEQVLAVVRPPPETSAYHERNPLYDRVLDWLAADEGVAAIVIPRTSEQAQAVRERDDPSLLAADRELDVQSLIALCDLVVGAGGTMNREAVALGTPAYTIFSGRMGAVDAGLIAEGRLAILDDPESLALRKRSTEPGPRHPRDPALLVEGVLGAFK
jgi:uncharacterized protein